MYVHIFRNTSCYYHSLLVSFWTVTVLDFSVCKRGKWYLDSTWEWKLCWFWGLPHGTTCENTGMHLVNFQPKHQTECQMPAPLPGKRTGHSSCCHWQSYLCHLTPKTTVKLEQMLVKMHLYVQSAAVFVFLLDGQWGRAMLWVNLATFLTLLARLLYSLGIILKTPMSTWDNVSFLTFSKVCSVSWVCLYWFVGLRITTQPFWRAVNK